MKKLIPALLCSTLILSSCGGKPSGAPKKRKDGVVVATLATFEDLINYKINLDVNTPVGVGAMLNVDKGDGGMYQLSTCTMFLLGPELAMTNSHCIPEIVKQGKVKDCGQFMHQMIQTQTGAERRACKRVLSFSKLNDNVTENDDYALFEIDQAVAGSEFFQLTRSGMQEDQSVMIHTLNHAEDESTEFNPSAQEFSIKSTYIKHTCVIKSSDAFGRFVPPYGSPVAGFKPQGQANAPRCRLIGGNSGSPVVDQAGNLVAIAHGGNKKSTLEEPTEESTTLFSGDVMIENKVTHNIAVLTNLACQKTGLADLDVEIPLKSCKQSRKQLKEDRYKKSVLLERTMTKKSNAAQYELLSSLPKHTLFLLKNDKLDNKGIFFKPVPGCVLKNSKAKLEYSLDHHSLTFGLELNYYGQLSVREYAPQILATTHYAYDLRSSSAVKVSMRQEMEDGTVKRMKKTVPYCSSADIRLYKKMLAQLRSKK